MKTLNQIFEALTYATHLKIRGTTYTIVHTLLDHYLCADCVDENDVTLVSNRGVVRKLNLSDPIEFDLVAKSTFQILVNLEDELSTYQVIRELGVTTTNAD